MSDSRVFKLPWSNPDLDVHPDPPEGWHRVAVLGIWTDAKRLRRDWPDAAVCGPLRTLRGIDLLVRGLLANPQIRVVVVVGRDLSPGQSVQRVLEEVFQGGPPAVEWIGTDILDKRAAMEAFNAVQQGVQLFRVNIARDGMELGYVDARVYQYALDPDVQDRPGGAIILPPPEPEPSDDLPPGLPGQRVTGKTLADVWPRVLTEVMRFGRVVPTQYGETRELLNLVSVVEDPADSIGSIRRGDGPLKGRVFGDRADPHPVLGISWQALDDYYTGSFMSEKPPERQEYGYGSRLRAGPWWGPCVTDVEHVTPRDGTVECKTCSSWVYSGDPAMPQPNCNLGVCPYCGARSEPHVNQIAAVRHLLADNPGTRAAYLTPWRPDEDCGKESGRPCFVGAWFRVTEEEEP